MPVAQTLQRHSGGWKQTPPAQRQAQSDQQQTQTQMGRPATIAGSAPPQPARDDVSESGAIQATP
jgi:hypothetical protein